MAKTKRNYINADDALNAGLNLEVAPYEPKEVVADKDGKYLGLNGTTIDDMQFVGTGQYINNTIWDKMAPGYSVVTNPYQAASPDQISKRQQASQVSTNRNDMELMGDEAYAQTLVNQKGWADEDALYKDALARGDTEAAEAHRVKRDGYHTAQEELRARYGYSGGADGSEHLGLMAYTKDLYAGEEDDDRDWGGSSGGFGGSGMGGGFSYEDAPQYLSKYQERIDALADAILNRPAFSYDPETDPTYQQYKASYTRDGKRAMQDTLAQVSARTGGLASSYAQGASQQAYNNYMAQLADKIPELKQLAYSMYMDDLNQDRADLSMLQGMEQTDYGKFLDKLGQWNTDRGFDYGVYRDDVADRQWQTQFDYGVHRDNVADSQWQQQFDYNASRDQVADSQWQTQFDYQKAQDALAQQNWQTQWDYQLKQDALAREDALRKLYAGGVSGTEKDPSLWSVIQGMTPAEAEMYMVEHKYGKDAIDRAMSLLNDSLSAGQLDADIAGIKSEADAKSVMTNAGVDSAVMGGMLSKDNWTRRKQRGGTDPAVVNYDTYEEYVRDYVTYAVGE